MSRSRAEMKPPFSPAAAGHRDANGTTGMSSWFGLAEESTETLSRCGDKPTIMQSTRRGSNAKTDNPDGYRNKESSASPSIFPAFRLATTTSTNRSYDAMSAQSSISNSLDPPRRKRQPGTSFFAAYKKPVPIENMVISVPIKEDIDDNKTLSTTTTGGSQHGNETPPIQQERMQERHEPPKTRIQPVVPEETELFATYTINDRIVYEEAKERERDDEVDSMHNVAMDEPIVEDIPLTPSSSVNGDKQPKGTTPAAVPTAKDDDDNPEQQKGGVVFLGWGEPESVAESVKDERPTRPDPPQRQASWFFRKGQDPDAKDAPEEAGAGFKESTRTSLEEAMRELEQSGFKVKCLDDGPAAKAEGAGAEKELDEPDLKPEVDDRPRLLSVAAKQGSGWFWGSSTRTDVIQKDENHGESDEGGGGGGDVDKDDVAGDQKQDKNAKKNKKSGWFWGSAASTDGDTADDEHAKSIDGIDEGDEERSGGDRSNFDDDASSNRGFETFRPITDDAICKECNSPHGATQRRASNSSAAGNMNFTRWSFVQDLSAEVEPQGKQLNESAAEARRIKHLQRSLVSSGIRLKKDELIEDEEKRKIRWDLNRRFMAHIFETYRSSLPAGDDLLAGKDLFGALQDAGDYNHEILSGFSNDMLEDGHLSEREIASFTEGLTLLSVKMKSLHSQMEGWKKLALKMQKERGSTIMTIKNVPNSTPKVQGIISDYVLVTKELKECQEQLQAEGVEFKDDDDSEEWEAANEKDNLVALGKLRRHMPVDIRLLSELQLSTMVTPNGKVLPKRMVKKFKKTNVLQLLRINPEEILTIHPSTLENLRLSGLTLTERRALHSHLRETGTQWAAMKQGDDHMERRWLWFTTMKIKFRQTLEEYQRHCEKYGPPHRHPPASRSRPDGCPFSGKQCPVKADKLPDYQADYGYPAGPVYEHGTLTLYEREIGSSSNQKAKEAPTNDDRLEELKKQHNGNPFQASLANASCQAMEETMSHMTNLLKGWEMDGDQHDAAAFIDAPDSDSFGCALRDLNLAVTQVVFRSGMRLTDKLDVNQGRPDVRGELELRLCVKFCSEAKHFLDRIVELSQKLELSDKSAKATIEHLRELLEELHNRNTSSLDRFVVKDELPTSSSHTWADDDTDVANAGPFGRRGQQDGSSHHREASRYTSLHSSPHIGELRKGRNNNNNSIHGDNSEASPTRVGRGSSTGGPRSPRSLSEPPVDRKSSSLDELKSSTTHDDGSSSSSQQKFDEKKVAAIAQRWKKRAEERAAGEGGKPETRKDLRSASEVLASIEARRNARRLSKTTATEPTDTKVVGSDDNEPTDATTPVTNDSSSSNDQKEDATRRKKSIEELLAAARERRSSRTNGMSTGAAATNNSPKSESGGPNRSTEDLLASIAARRQAREERRAAAAARDDKT